MIDIASLILRICLGGIFAAHGLQKVFGMFGGPGIEGFSKMLSELGFAVPLVWAYAVGYVELICGALVIIGLLTRVSSLLLLIVMTVAALKVHLPNGFFLQSGGVEFVLIIAAVCIVLLFLGPGKYAVHKKL